MAKRRKPAKPVSKRPRAPTRFVIPAMFFLLLILLLYSTFLVVRGPVELHGPSEEPAAGCSEGEMKACSVGACNGTATCVNGAWSTCRWTRICIPGSKEPCLKNGCYYAYKECNGCGTGHGSCVPLE